MFGAVIHSEGCVPLKDPGGITFKITFIFKWEKKKKGGIKFTIPLLPQHIVNNFSL